jgi:hypothetical protein
MVRIFFFEANAKKGRKLLHFEAVVDVLGDTVLPGSDDAPVNLGQSMNPIQQAPLAPTSDLSVMTSTPLQASTWPTIATIVTCAECGICMPDIEALEAHAKDKHYFMPRICTHEGCFDTFLYPDTLQRHMMIHDDMALRWPCQYCTKYQGLNGFKRKDHLTQHERNFHQIGTDGIRSTASSCPYASCKYFRPGAYSVEGERRRFSVPEHAFRTSQSFQKHMRRDHDESVFPCLAPNCTRRGGKGYFRKRDLEKHQTKEHGNAVAAQLKKEISEWRDIVPSYFKHLVYRSW